MNSYIKITIKLIIVISLFPLLVVADTVTYFCEYSTYSDERGNHKVKDLFELKFIVDTNADKSYMLGNLGSVEVVKIENEDQIGFVDVTNSGNIMSTTIDSQLKSAHSRNTVIYGEITPSQYYGSCEIK